MKQETQFSNIKVSQSTAKVFGAMAALDNLHDRLCEMGEDGVLDPYVESLETIEYHLKRVLIGTIYAQQPARGQGKRYQVI